MTYKYMSKTIELLKQADRAELNQLMDDWNRLFGPCSSNEIIHTIMYEYEKYRPSPKFRTMQHYSLIRSEILKAWLIELDPTSIRFLTGLSEELYELAISIDVRVIKLIKYPSEDLCLKAVKLNPWVIGDIKNPSLTIQRTAVEKDGTAIMYIKNQLDELKMIAVKQNGFALRFIAQQTFDICVAAVKRRPGAINEIKDPSMARRILTHLGHKHFEHISTPWLSRYSHQSYSINRTIVLKQT